MARLVLRSGLDTLEVCAVVLRAVCRSLRELAPEHQGEPSLYEGEVARSLERLMDRVATAVDSFGRLITAQVSAGADQAEQELDRALREGRAEREQLARMLRAQTERDWEGWELHGALLTSVDRMLNELDVERRARWLAEQVGADEPVPGAMVDRLRRGARSASDRLRRPGPREG